MERFPSRVWLQLAFDWVPYGPIPAVSDAYADSFEQALVELGFAVASVDASTRSSMVQGLRRSFNLPDWCQSLSWGSITDCLDEVVWPTRQAVMLRHSDDFAAASPKDFGETCVVLTRYFDRLVDRQIVIVITGSGPTFYDPSHPSPDREADKTGNSPVALARRAREARG